MPSLGLATTQSKLLKKVAAMEKVKGSSTNKPANIKETPVINWEVFVTPGIPIVTSDRPPGVHETFFQAMASTLIMASAMRS
jgi:hypothetical protein